MRESVRKCLKDIARSIRTLRKRVCRLEKAAEKKKAPAAKAKVWGKRNYFQNV